MSTFTLVVANLHDDPRSLHGVLPGADYLLCNEARTRCLREIRALPAEWGRSTWAGAGRQNPHVWVKETVTALGNPRTAALTAGGRIGLTELAGRARLKRRYRKRRLGPGRAATARLVEVDGERVWMVAVHLPARWTTSERWRRFLIRRVVLPRLRRFLNRLAKINPRIIVGGDMNADPKLYMGAAFTPVKTMADMGGRHYTQVHHTAGVSVSNVSEIRNASDHDAPVMEVTLS